MALVTAEVAAILVAVILVAVATSAEAVTSGAEEAISEVVGISNPCSI